MSAAHTPGPWFAKREGFSTVYIEGRIRPGVLQEIAACGPTEAGPETQEANARLIAAAPELLLALQSLMNLFEQHEQAAHTTSPVGDYARAAIAKATGATA